MKISKTEFLAILQSLKPGIAKKEIVEQFTSFIFNNDMVFTYNDDVAVQHPLESGFVGSLNADKLTSFMDKLKADEVTMNVVDSEVIFKCGKITSGFKLDSNIDHMLGHIKAIGAPEKWYKIPEDFLQAISFCLFSAGTDATKPKLMCLHFKNEIVEASDGYRMTIYSLDTPLKKEILVPANTLKALPQYTVTHYGITDGWIHFKMDNGAIYSCRVFHLDYPDLSVFLKVDGPSVKVPSSIADVMERAKIFATAEFDQDRKVSLILEGNKMLINGNDEHGWIKERVILETEVEERIEFKIHPDFLIEVAKLLDDMVIGKNKIKLEGNKFKHVICIG